MLFQTSVTPTSAEKIFRVGVNANTATLTITAGSIAIGSPVIMETSSASANGYHINRPATSTSIVNNLYAGNLHDAPGTKIYLDREEVGLVQCYGYDDDAIVQVLTSTSLAGQICIPSTLQFLIPAGGPVTVSAATETASHVEQPAIGGLALLLQSIASSAATDTTTAKVFVRAM